MKTAKEFLKDLGYFDNPHFPFGTIEMLMEQYASKKHKDDANEKLMVEALYYANEEDAKDKEKLFDVICKEIRRTYSQWRKSEVAATDVKEAVIELIQSQAQERYDKAINHIVDECEFMPNSKIVKDQAIREALIIASGYKPEK